MRSARPELRTAPRAPALQLPSPQSLLLPPSPSRLALFLLFPFILRARGVYPGFRLLPDFLPVSATNSHGDTSQDAPLASCLSARIIKALLPPWPRLLTALLRTWRPADEQDGVLSPPTLSSPSLQALFLHLIRFFSCPVLAFLLPMLPFTPLGQAGGAGRRYRQGSASPWGWRAPARRGAGWRGGEGRHHPAWPRFLHKLL